MRLVLLALLLAGCGVTKQSIAFEPVANTCTAVALTRPMSASCGMICFNKGGDPIGGVVPGNCDSLTSIFTSATNAAIVGSAGSVAASFLPQPKH